MASPWEAGALLAHEEAEGGQGDPWQAEEGDPEEGGVLSSSAVGEPRGTPTRISGYAQPGPGARECYTIP